MKGAADMKTILRVFMVVTTISLIPGIAAATDFKGRIEVLDHTNQVLVVKGIPFHTTPATKYDDGLRSFEDLRPGMNEGRDRFPVCEWDPLCYEN